MQYIGPYGEYSLMIDLLIFAMIPLRSYDRSRNIPLTFLVSMIVGVVLNVALVAVRSIVTINDDVYLYLRLFIVFFIILFIYRIPFRQAMYIMGLAYAAQYIMYAIWVDVCVFFVPDFQFMVNTWLCTLIYYVDLLLNVLLLWRITKVHQYLATIKKFSLPVLLSFVLVVLAATAMTRWAFDLDSMKKIALVSSCAAVVCGLSMSYASLLLVHNQVKTEQALHNLLIERQKTEYQLSQQSIEALNIKCHDLKYQVRALYKKMKSGETADLKEIESTIDQFQCSYHTGHDALDVIISEKARLCDQKQIAFTFMGDGSLLRHVDDVDIYRLFSNAIDNAIEAVEKTEPEKRIIGVNVTHKGPFVAVHFENYCDIEVQMVGGMPQTSKADKENHGFGVRSIKMIADKYQAEFLLSCKNDVFTLDLLFPYQPA